MIRRDLSYIGCGLLLIAALFAAVTLFFALAKFVAWAWA